MTLKLLREPNFNFQTSTIKTLTLIPKNKYEAAKMAQQLRAFGVLQRTWGQVPSTHIRRFIVTYNSSSIGSGFYGNRTCTWCTFTCIHVQLLTHTHKIKKKNQYIFREWILWMMKFLKNIYNSFNNCFCWVSNSAHTEKNNWRVETIAHYRVFP